MDYQGIFDKFPNSTLEECSRSHGSGFHYVYLAIAGFPVLCVLLSTFLDVFCRLFLPTQQCLGFTPFQKETLLQGFRNLSVISSTVALCSSPAQKTQQRGLASLQNIGALAILWLLWKQTMAALDVNDTSHSSPAEQISYNIMLQDHFHTDILYVISGFLLTLKVSQVRFKGSNWTQLVTIPASKWCSVFPTAVVLTTVAYLFTTMKIKDFSCPVDATFENYFWMHPLALTNLIPRFYEQLFPHLAVLCIDFQLTLAMLPVIRYTFKEFQHGAGILLSLYLTAVYSVGVLRHAQTLPSLITLPPVAFKQMMYTLHTRPYIHYPAFATGICVCFLFLNTKHIRLNKIAQTLYWVLGCVAFCVAVVPIPSGFLTSFSDFQKAVIEAGIRTVSWNLSLLSFTYMCATEQAGVLGNVLEWKIFTPLSKISFSAFLVHSLTLLYGTPYKPDSAENIYMAAVKAIVFSLAASVPTHIFVESCFNRLYLAVKIRFLSPLEPSFDTDKKYKNNSRRKSRSFVK